MSTTGVLSPTEFESRLERYLFERSEEGRAVRVGEKEISEQAAIVERYRDLFTREQLDALRSAEDGAEGEEQELLFRLRKTCEGGLIANELTEDEDELENSLLAERIVFKGEEMPLRTAQARLAVLSSYADREALGRIQAEASETFNPDRLQLLSRNDELAAELSGIPGAVERNEDEKGISLRELSAALERASDALNSSYSGLKEKWLAELLGDERDELPTNAHTAYMRRLSPLEATYTKERATEVCLETPRGARLRPGRAAEHPPRSRRPAAEVAARMRDRE